MRAVWLVLSILAACGDPRVPRTQPAAPASNAMRVMSYNVNFGIAGDPSTIEAIAAAKPDIVFLQETTDEWAAPLVAKLGDRYPHRKFQGPVTNWIAGGMGVMSKHPIVSVDQLDPPPGAPFFAWRVVLDTPLGRIQAINVHLRPPMSDGGSWVVGYWSTRGDRLREMQHHLESLDPKLPTLILGDFNEEHDGRAMELLRDRGFTDALATYAGKTRTWEWPVSGFTLKFQLDHIMHDDRFVAVTAAVVEAGRSDHKPIWADFERIDP